MHTTFPRYSLSRPMSELCKYVHSLYKLATHSNDKNKAAACDSLVSFIFDILLISFLVAVTNYRDRWDLSFISHLTGGNEKHVALISSRIGTVNALLGMSATAAKHCEVISWISPAL